MKRVNFFNQESEGGGCDVHRRPPAQELRAEEQGETMSFSKFPGVPATAGWEERFPKKHAPILLLLLMCLAVLPRLAAQDIPKVPVKTTLFWKASSGTNVIYLLGSIHVGPRMLYPLPTEVEDAFESSGALVVEVDAKHLDQQKIQALVEEEGLYRGEDLLWNHVSKGARQNIEQFCSTYGIPEEKVSKMRPWLAAIVAFAIPTMKGGMRPEFEVDRYFLDRVDQSKDKKQVVEIDSVEMYLKLLSGFADDVQEEILADAMEAVDRMPERIKQLEEVWLSGDADRLDKLMSEPSHSSQQVRKALGQDRHSHMADVAEQFLNGKEQAFIVVGGGNLVGKEGVVSILRTRGYKVEQVSLKP
jgi:uncharacterized protein YbaP (TraB family)